MLFVIICYRDETQGNVQWNKEVFSSSVELWGNFLLGKPLKKGFSLFRGRNLISRKKLRLFRMWYFRTCDTPSDIGHVALLQPQNLVHKMFRTNTNKILSNFF